MLERTWGKPQKVSKQLKGKIGSEEKAVTWNLGNSKIIIGGHT